MPHRQKIYKAPQITPSGLKPNNGHRIIEISFLADEKSRYHITLLRESETAASTSLRCPAGCDAPVEECLVLYYCQDAR